MQKLIDSEKLLKELKISADHHEENSRDYVLMLRDRNIVREQQTVLTIPDNPTNGDMFLATHPNVVATKLHKEGNLFDVVQLRIKGDTIPFAEIYIDWWNAPYKRGDIDEP